MSVGKSLFRIYRPIALWFGLALVLVEVAAVAGILILHPVGVSPWLLVAGTAPRYWLLVVGTTLVQPRLRQFVSNGATRREFVLAGAVLGLSLAVAVAILAPLGHGLENAVLASADRRGTGYPVFTAGRAFTEFGRSLATSLAGFVSGGLFAATFYRYQPWTGFALLLPAAVPLAASEALLSYDVIGTRPDLLPYWPALLITSAAVLGGAYWLRMTVWDVAIRRT